MPGTGFIIIAASMVIAALTLIVIPLTRNADQSPLAAGVIVALLPLSAALLYFSYSNWQWDLPPDAPQVAGDSQAASL
ncbi:MAG: hypothetical protein OEQ74_11040, partial [Gammaproteobacteria bacterium]|nr:hypothetical protein [Gammaproteobacteria bacterium]